MKNQISAIELAGSIDHTLLTAEAGSAAIEQLCDQAAAKGFATACVHPCHVSRAVRLLKGSPGRVGSVVGFPCGANHWQIKRAEAVQAIEDGVDELDMVINLAAAIEGDMDYVVSDVEAVLEPCRTAGRKIVLKVIMETAALPKAAKVTLCGRLSELGVDFLKTSTGLHPAGGATGEDVELLYAHRGGCRVKAAGGIRTLATAMTMLRSGAERLGTSSGMAILEELERS